MRLRLVMCALAMVAAGLGYRLLLGEASLADLAERERRIAAAQAGLDGARERNAVLAAEVADLRTGLETVEERARADLGMIRPGETYYRIIGDRAAP